MTVDEGKNIFDAELESGNTTRVVIEKNRREPKLPDGGPPGYNGVFNKKYWRYPDV